MKPTRPSCLADGPSASKVHGGWLPPSLAGRPYVIVGGEPMTCGELGRHPGPCARDPSTLTLRALGFDPSSTPTRGGRCTMGPGHAEVGCSRLRQIIIGPSRKHPTWAARDDVISTCDRPALAGEGWALPRKRGRGRCVAVFQALFFFLDALELNKVRSAAR